MELDPDERIVTVREKDASPRDAQPDTFLDATGGDATGSDGGAPDSGKYSDVGANCEAGCRLFSNRCNGCACLALSRSESNPSCDGGLVTCIVDPCDGKTAICTTDGCSVQ